MLLKLKLWFWTLERWFGLPFFLSACIMGIVIAGGSLRDCKVWLAIGMATALMCSGHCWNSVLDYVFGIDKGEITERSAEKVYSGGQSVIASGLCSLREAIIVSVLWSIISIVLAIILWVKMPSLILAIAVIGLAIPFLYTVGKFTVWGLHELSLGIAAGPLAVLTGMYAVNAHPNIITGLLVSVPFAIVLSFLGLSLDEWPDAQQNLAKGTRSIPYKIWEYSDLVLEHPAFGGHPDADSRWVKSLAMLQWYCSTWLLFMCTYHVFLIAIGVLKPLTGIALFVSPVCIPLLVMLKKDFRKFMIPLVAVGGLYCVLLLLGEALG